MIGRLTMQVDEIFINEVSDLTDDIIEKADEILKGDLSEDTKELIKLMQLHLKLITDSLTKEMEYSAFYKKLSEVEK